MLKFQSKNWVVSKLTKKIFHFYHKINGMRILIVTISESKVRVCRINEQSPNPFMKANPRVSVPI